MGALNWSQDASSNDVADPPILWSEGQGANTINNSGRAVMAGVATWLADLTNIPAARGAGDVYVAGTAQGLATPAAGAAGIFNRPFLVGLTVNASNEGPARLQLDGTGPFNIHRTLNRVLAPGDLVPGVPYLLRFQPGFGYQIVAPTILSPGRIVAHGGPNVDPGWVACDGRAVSRSAYAALYAELGDRWGAGDGATTFNVPDFRGRTLFGTDGTGRIDAAYGLAPQLGSVGGAATVALTPAQMPSHTHGGSTGGAGGHDHGGSTSGAGSHDHGSATAGAGGHTHGASTTTAGSHAHTGTTGTGGQHGHPIGYNVGTAGSGSTNRVVGDITPNGSRNAGGASDLGGDHAHDFTTSGAGDHSHGVTVGGVGDHAHGIPAAPNHAHGIPAVGDHSHALSLEASGGGQAHTNIPPGAVVLWAIKG